MTLIYCYMTAVNKRMPLIIAVSGKLGTGKDYLIDHLLLPKLRARGISRMAFADHIKINVASQEGIPLEDLLIGDKTPANRKKLQIAGTEHGRDRYGEDIWVDTLANWIKLRAMREENLDVVLISDCRFPNEARFVESNGGLLIRIEAQNRNHNRLKEESKGDQLLYESISLHASEVSLDSYRFSHVVQNDYTDVNTVPQQIDNILHNHLARYPEHEQYIPL